MQPCSECTRLPVPFAIIRCHFTHCLCVCVFRWISFLGHLFLFCRYCERSHSLSALRSFMPFATSSQQYLYYTIPIKCNLYKCVKSTASRVRSLAYTQCSFLVQMAKSPFVREWMNIYVCVCVWVRRDTLNIVWPIQFTTYCVRIINNEAKKIPGDCWRKRCR